MNSNVTEVDIEGDRFLVFSSERKALSLFRQKIMKVRLRTEAFGTTRGERRTDGTPHWVGGGDILYQR